MAQTSIQVVLAMLNWWLHVSYMIRKVRIVLAIILALEQHMSRIRRTLYTLDFEKKREHLRHMIYYSDRTCYNQIRMYRSTFDRLCSMLDTIGGLKPSKNVLVDEQVAMFLHILAHHMKNRVIQFEFGRSGETVSRYFRVVLKALMKLHLELFKSPEPIPEDSTDERWRWFKNCLGALDGTHIRIRVAAADQPRYRNRKGEITTNVLAVCSPEG